MAEAGSRADDDGMDQAALAELLARQDDLVARFQLGAADGRPHDLERMVRRRELVRVLPGVFVAHTGPLTWTQRAWAGVLHLWPAALDLESALVDRGRDGPHVIQLAVDHRRRVRAPAGYAVRRVVGLQDRVRWTTSPPRVRTEVAALDVAALAGSDLAAVELLARLCRDRRTTATRLRATLANRARHPRRAWVDAVLTDLEVGTCSVLERGYLDLVERPHGLPSADRQVPATGQDGRRLLRDVEHAPYGLVVELDGRMFHDDPRQRARDLERDLDAALDRRQTVRLGWTQVFDHPCRTAGKVGRLLGQRGWHGRVTGCRPACAALSAAA